MQRLIEEGLTSNRIRKNTEIELNLAGDENDEDMKGRKERRNEKIEWIGWWIGNAIGDKGVKAISESLKINTSLTKLSLNSEKRKEKTEKNWWEKMPIKMNR